MRFEFCAELRAVSTDERQQPTDECDAAEYQKEPAQDRDREGACLHRSIYYLNLIALR